MKKRFFLLLFLLISVSLLSGCAQIPNSTTHPSEDSEHKANAQTPTPSRPTNQTEDGAEIDYTQAYESLITEWKSCLIRHNNGEETADDMFDFNFYSDSSADLKAYYSFYDIDGNGIPELILRKECMKEDIIAYIFTLKNDVPINIFGYEYGNAAPWSRVGGAVILSNGLIDCTNGNYSIYKIADDGYTLLKIASSEPYNYPNEASLAEADWRYYANDTLVDYNFYVQCLNEQGYSIDKSNALAVIEWIDMESAISTTTKRIHESMPEFTFYHIVGNMEPEPWCGSFSAPTKVSIIVKDEKGNVIQEITGLTQSQSFTNEEIIFDDFNFDGYLDMRLKRWQEGAGLLKATEYYWLWDIETSQFVLNEQLVEIGHAADLSVNSDTRQIVVFNRGGGDFLSHLVDYYEFHDRAFMLVFQEHYLPKFDQNYQLIHREIIRTDVRTGIITIEIEPAPNEEL